MDTRPHTFDRELGIRELLSGVSAQRLEELIGALLGGEFRLVDARGERVLGRSQPFAAPQRVAVEHELEALAHLEAEPGTAAQLKAVAGLLEQILRVSARYHMAADLHIETVQEDYAALQQKHAALQASETRYKALSEQLEERVKAQVQTIETAQRQLYQAEKLASIGQLAAGVAHEINNPIGFIRSNLSTARQYVRDLGNLGDLLASGDLARFHAAWKASDMSFVLKDFAELLNESIDGADRVAKIVADLKGFSNVDRAEEEMVDLNDNLQAVCSVVAGQFRGRVELLQDLHPLPKLLCLPGHLNQVFLNLLLNAAQAVSEAGLSTPGQVEVLSDMADGQIRIRIRDNGCGIPEGNLERIFEPFFTTRPVGSGTGLGLTVSRDIVQAHGGRIDVESRVGAGTTFTIHLPIG